MKTVLAIAVVLFATAAHAQCDAGLPCEPYPAVTNYVRSSQDLMWGWSSAGGCAVEGGVVVAPSCAASFNTRGCGLMTAGRIRCPAVASGVNAFVYQSDVCPSGMRSAGAFFRASDGGTATPGLYVGGSVYVYEVGGWVRSKVEGVTSGSTTFAIGNFGPAPALDVDFWQADCQDSLTLLPPVVTGAVPVRREAGCVPGQTRKLWVGGDSTMTATDGLQAAAVRFAHALGPSYGWLDGAESGSTCAGVRARWAVARDAGVTHAALFCGVNDARTGRTAEEAWADQEAVLSDAVDAGIPVRLIRTLNFEGAGDADETKVARINTLRGYQQAWCAANNRKCADPAVALQTGNAIKTEFQQDPTHPNAAGHQHLDAEVTSWPARYAEGW